MNYKEYLENVVIPVAEELEKKNKEIERLNNIIKEVRELVENKYIGELSRKILEILDKENK